MSIFQVLALLLTLAASFAYANHRWVKLPSGIALMAMSLTISLGLVGLDAIVVGRVIGVHGEFPSPGFRGGVSDAVLASRQSKQSPEWTTPARPFPIVQVARPPQPQSVRSIRRGHPFMARSRASVSASPRRGVDGGSMIDGEAAPPSSSRR